MERIMLVEDHASFRQTLAYVLGDEPDFEVVAQAGTLAEARAILKDFGGDLDVILVDLDLPDGEGIELIKNLRESDLRPATLILTASLDRAYIARAVEAGAAGVLHKSADLEEIISSVRRLLAGEALLSATEVIEMLRLASHTRQEEREARQAAEKLTPREIEVLQALAEGLSNKEIAGRLHISVETERSHMMNILAKLGAHSRLQALLFAVRYGIVEI